MEAAPYSQRPQGFVPALGTAGRISVVAALGVGAALRLWFFARFFEVSGDSLVYGGIAKNLVQQGHYALTLANGATFPTLIRLPGYPFFLAMCFRLFGMENYASVAWVQIALGLFTCILIADLARRMVPAHRATATVQAALWLAVLCPFTAIYEASPLTEGPTLFSIALALWSTVRFLNRPRWRFALTFTFAVTWAALLRPDGALAAFALVPALGLSLRRQGDAARLARMALVCALLAAMPFALWTARNWRVFHVVQPLAPQSATDPGDPVYPGWEQWVKTWSLDFATTYTVYWNVPDNDLDLNALPARAFDSAGQHDRTAALIQAYNSNGWALTPSLDAGFAALARERIVAHPARHYLWLPLGRVADMWLRPRIENLPIDIDWWVYAHHNAETRFSWFYAALNGLYLLLALAGLCLRPRLWAALLAYLLLRSALLATLAAPEARYTLECFPMLFALGAVALGRVFSPGPRR